MKMLFTVELVLLVAVLGVCSTYQSCKDLKKAKPSAKNGEYVMRIGKAKSYKTYCEFHGTYGYQFVPKNAIRFSQSALDLVSPSKAEVLVRHARTDGKQYDTVMDQISSFVDVPLSIQYDQNDGYARPLNAQTWAPYIYLGFLPIDVANQKRTQGYAANGRDFTFTNCDGNPNSYLAFFFNKKIGSPTDYYLTCCYTPLMREWINTATPASNRLPCHYFFQFEMHMGGCGGYAINGYNSLQDITGAALGLRFEL